jgi:hypothetical protein
MNNIHIKGRNRSPLRNRREAHHHDKINFGSRELLEKTEPSLDRHYTETSLRYEGQGATTRARPNRPPLATAAERFVQRPTRATTARVVFAVHVPNLVHPTLR